jgi:putative SOS response-associated peptidase YedK
MCGRFSRQYTWQQLHALYRLSVPEAIPNFQPDYNVCPTDPADVVLAKDGARELGRFRWAWCRSGGRSHSRSCGSPPSTRASRRSPPSRSSASRSRATLPDALSGYYEWQDTSGGKQPWYFTARDGAPLITAAGLWDEWRNRETGERIKSCSMIITEPNDFVAEVHDRMPVLLQPEQFDHWLSGDMTVEELKPAPNDTLQRWMVSKRVNSSKADKDDPTLTEPVKQAA